MSTKIFVLFWLDTEDWVTPESDDAALMLAQIFSEHGIKATFKVVGEKARALEKRGRKDVIDALKRHDIGFHDNLHSKHPVISQYLSEMDWDEGVEEFIRREGPGVESVRRIFGKTISCYGCGGGNWNPIAYGAMLRWGIPAYVSGVSFVPLWERPFYFCKIISFSELNCILISFDIDSPQGLNKAKREFIEVYHRRLSEGGGVVNIAMHPNTWVCDGWWDVVNFGRGREPLIDGYVMPKLKPKDRIENGYKNFSEFVKFVITQPDTKAITVSEASEIYKDRTVGNDFGVEELTEVALKLSMEINFVKTSKGWISAAEGLGMLVNALTRYADEGILPQLVKCQPLLGPVRRCLPDEKVKKVPFLLFLEGVKETKAYIEHYGRVPSEVWLGAMKLPLANFCSAVARVFLEIIRKKEITEVEIVPGNVTCEQFAKEEYARICWEWGCFPEGFSAPKILELTKLQTWSLKPAEPSG